MFGTLDDATLVDQFDLVIDITSEEQNIDIHTFMKSQNVHDEKSTISFLEMLKNKLRHARQLQVTLSPEARQLLKAYFLANRKLREFGPQAIEFPTMTMATLVRLASSHAKLRHSSTVSLADALIAIEIVEETLLAKYNNSLLGFKKLPNAKRNLDFYGSTTASRYIEFYKHVQYFCQLHVDLREL
jgi:DNA replicative helicase MCM subunit Mcm2 (Cdc46/Mcm family)